MPCNQVVTTTLTVKDEALFRGVLDSIAGREGGSVRDMGANTLHMDMRTGTIVLTKGYAENRLTISGGYGTERTQQLIRTEYADTMLVRAMGNVGFVWEGSGPMTAEVARELGGGVEHTFIDQQGRSVTIGRAFDGRLHFDFGQGYSEYDAQKAADLIVLSMNQMGLVAGPVTINKRSERWLEEKLPDRERESE